MGTTRDIKIVDLGLTKFVAQRNALAGHGVKTGIQANAGMQDGVSILDYAIWNEFGLDTTIKKGKRKGQRMVIPARPFVRDFFERNQRALGAAMDRASAEVDNGMPVSAALDELGKLIEGQQKRHVQQSKSWAVPNAPSTIARKGSDKPLMDHGFMVDAIRYVKI